MNPRKSLTSGILSYGTVAVTNIQDKANLLECFSACFNSTFVPSTVKSSPIPSESSLDEDLSYCDCTIPEIEALLRNVKCGTATGPDRITAWMLRTFSEAVSPSISSLFNLSIRTGKLPNVVPILRRLHCAMMFVLFNQYHYCQS